MFHAQYSQETIESFWNDEVKSKFEHFKNYIVDFVLIVDGSQSTDPSAEVQTSFQFGAQKIVVKVIEINPFDNLTNGTLYRWDVDLDELHNGPLHFRVRYRTTSHTNFFHCCLIANSSEVRLLSPWHPNLCKQLPKVFPNQLGTLTNPFL